MKVSERNTLSAVVDQLAHGYASDLLDLDADIDAFNQDTIRDLIWCREQLRALLTGEMPRSVAKGWVPRNLR